MSPVTTASPSPEPGETHSMPAAAVREVDSRDLLAGQRELLIRHAQDLYRLRVTAQGKLILTK